MSKLTTIYVVRHGQSEENVAEFIGGTPRDAHLTQKGRAEAQSTAEYLEEQGIKIDHFYSSDLARAIQTGEIIAGQPIPKDNQIKGFAERDFGEMKGMPKAAIQEAYREQMKLLPEERWNYRHLDSYETDHELSTRFITTIEQVARKHPDQVILVAAHGNAIRTTLMKLGYGGHDDFPPRSFKNGGYAVFLFDGDSLIVKEVYGHKKP